MLIWPESVLVLEPEWADLGGKPGADKSNQPQSAMGWAELEFRPPYPASRHSIDIMLGIFEYHHRCLSSYRAKYPQTYNHHDVYNATWAALGYKDDNTRKALTLAGLRFPKPYEDRDND